MFVGIAPLLAELGLFFCGIHFIASNLALLERIAWLARQNTLLLSRAAASGAAAGPAS